MEAIGLSGGGDSPTKTSFAIRVGLALMALSFLVYPAYAFLPFLELDSRAIAGAAVGASLASWGLFSLGAALAGRDALTHLRDALRRVTKRLGGKGSR